MYRQTYEIPDELGTAVNVMQMVFGNKGDDCATGVCFSRDPSTGEQPGSTVPRALAHEESEAQVMAGEGGHVGARALAHVQSREDAVLPQL